MESWVINHLHLPRHLLLMLCDTSNMSANSRFLGDMLGVCDHLGIVKIFFLLCQTIIFSPHLIHTLFFSDCYGSETKISFASAFLPFLMPFRGISCFQPSMFDLLWSLVGITKCKWAVKGTCFPLYMMDDRHTHASTKKISVSKIVFCKSGKKY